MGCSCKHNEQAIKDGLKLLEEFRELFIKRMTVDSETHDARRKDFNQAIFFYDDYAGEHIQCFNDTSMEMVLDKFDLAVKDWRKTFCDVPDCRRKVN